jgi:two-component system sensor histidine kinase QseC
MIRLRRRLLISTATATALIFAAAAMAIYFTVRQAILDEFDKGMTAKANALMGLTRVQGTDVQVRLDASHMKEFGPKRKNEYFALWTETGELVAKSPSHGEVAPDFPDYWDFDDEEPYFNFVKLPTGTWGREIAVVFRPRARDAPAQQIHPLLLIYSRETSALDDELNRLAALLAAVCGGATVAAVVVMLLVVNHGLRPIDTLASRIAAVGQTDLTERVELQGIAKELTPLVLRLNELLARIEGDFRREKGFTSDVAHELRTPLAGLETALEVCAARRRDVAEYQEVVGDCLRTVRWMHVMVDNLLTIARADAGQLERVADRFELRELIQECWGQYEARAAERGLRIEWHLEGACPLETDREKLRLVVNNLMDNAVSYADEGGRVVFYAAVYDGRCEMEVSNSGCALSAQEVGRVFERFWRGDIARSETGVHCGLGLSLCRKLIDLLGGSIQVLASGGMFTVKIGLPTAAGTSAGAGASATGQPV